MKIVYTGDADSVHLQRWVHEMHARGAECHVLTRRPAAVPGAASVQALHAGDDALGWFAALPAVRARVREIAPDVVHGHYVTSNGLWAAWSGARPVVLTAWGSDLLVTPQRSALARALTRRILARADLLTGDSDDLLAAMRALGARAPCELLLWGADTARFRPAEPPPAPEPLTFISLRSWEPNYRIDTILQALAELRRREPGRRVRLLLLGGGAQADALRAQAHALGLLQPQADGEPTAVFLGRQDDAGMVRAMQRSHVSVSVPESDATSVSLLESLACGLAVIASDLPANRAWVDAAGGRRVPAGDAAALADAMQALAGDAAALGAMGRHNRALALQRASRQGQMDRMWTLYRGLVDRHGARPMSRGVAR